jgi:glycosyltransferase involved in cell wall biosynthesis
MLGKSGLHVVGLPHTQASKKHSLCAYTMKHYNFCNMMASIGYDIYSYHGEHPEMDAKEHITIYSDADQEKWFGNHDYKTKFYNITWNPGDEHWVKGNNKAIEEIRKRYQKNDIICLIAGHCQKQIADAFPDAIVVEYGIGYTGVFANFKVFESYSHMHWVYGSLHTDDGKFYDSVIPNYFDLNDFELQLNKEDYYLFIGRLIQRKGAEIAVEATRRLGKKLIMAGQGVLEQGDGYVVAEDGMRYEGDHIEHIGSVEPAQRSQLMGGALATFVPTTYIEPFGGVSIESMLCGTPVVASDFGAFTETVIPDISGFRFRTIGEATKAAEYASHLRPADVRKYAVNNFSTEVVKWKYDNYFQQLIDLYNGGGFYSDWSGNLSLRYGVRTNY